MDVHYLPSAKEQMDKVSNFLVNIVEHLAAEKPDISFRSCWGAKNKYWSQQLYCIW